MSFENYLDKYAGQPIRLLCGGPSMRGFDLSGISGMTASINEIGIDFPTDLWIGGNAAAPRFPEAFWHEDKIHFFREGLGWTPRAKNLVTWKEQPGSELDVDRFAAGSEVVFEVRDVLRGKSISRKSIMLAALGILYRLGFREVRLLGCDWRYSSVGQYGHDHRHHGDGGEAECNEQLELLSRWFSQLEPHFRQIGYRVLNCTPGGELNVFERADWREF